MSDQKLPLQDTPSHTDSWGDPLGDALKEYLSNPSSSDTILVHIDIAEEEYLPVAHFFRNEQTISELEKQALTACRGHVLDIGAGAGSLSLILQSRGLTTTAIDVSEGAVWVMNQRGVQNAHCVNILDFGDEKYDTLLMMMNGLGVVGTLDGLANFLEQAKDMLKPDGQILLDSADILYMYEDEEGGYWIDLNGAYYGEVTYQMEYKQVKGEPFAWLFVSFDVLSEYAETAGFTCELLFTDENDQYLARLTQLHS
ncbi:class I SAM-dependent methyltransferase [Xanthocytophaga agilis]|uniref:Class I SAM-dependent methyltransferase n=1 Tax=Xanthocytophaga agilis TaxID=3048010 RepID=A0AAE3UGU6_9BACT|nr:class I SAM-dependent methyltransferase [Xanthocytophaga agilis]MDJ1504735.1 class I SAM-dependent methyltransferase [Xanthocytophaga agilis]